MKPWKIFKMKSITISLVRASFLLVYYLFVSIPTLAQVTPDGTTSTTVTSPDGGNFTINDGDRAGNNLFHSFQDFSVPTNGSAFFNNAATIDNIINRVTGGNISNIDGLIRANGNANVFLINPAGIIFGSNAKLDIGGSFLGSTADSLLFPEGEFSATNLDNPPLLTINAPIGLGIRDNPGNIVNQSVADGVGLQVPLGESITLVGGDINLAGGKIFAGGGRVELGGLSTAGNIGINADGSLNFPDGIARADISLTNQATVDVRAGGGGFINFNARNVTLSELSKIFAGIGENTNSLDAQAGDITIDATESLKLIGTGLDINELVGLTTVVISGRVTTSNLEILTGVIYEAEDAGQAGDIIVNTPNLLIQGGGFLGSTVLANSNNNTENTTRKSSADVIISNAQQVELDSSFITTLANRNTERNPGDITINTERLLVKEGAAIASATFGNGDGGDLTINASESIEVTTTLPGSIIPTIITSNTIFGEGQAGNITIDTENLTIREGGAISSSSGGNIFVGENPTIGNILEPSDFQIGSNGNILLVQGGIAGNLDIKADSIEITGSSLGNQFPSALTSESTTSAKAGNINIDTNQLTISDGAEVRVSSVLTGDGGNINIQTDSLILENQALISAQAIESGDGGNINIDAESIIAFPNQNNDIVANAERGSGGNITITTEAILGLEERNSVPPNNTNDIDASSEFGLSGNVTFNVPDTNNFQDTPQLSDNTISPDTIASNVCSADSGVSSFIVKGKGGVPPTIISPLNAQILLGDGKAITPNISHLNHQDTTHNILPQIQPIKTSLGDIYPARGIIKTEDGRVILTAYPTRDDATRIPINLVNCS